MHIVLHIRAIHTVKLEPAVYLWESLDAVHIRMLYAATMVIAHQVEENAEEGLLKLFSLYKKNRCYLISEQETMKLS